MKRYRTVICILLALAMVFALCACGSKDKDKDEVKETSEPAAAETEQKETEDRDAKEEVMTEDLSQVVKSIDEIDTEDMKDEPLQIESVTLFEDGSLRIVPREDLLRNAETNDELKGGAMYPFADSGKVQDFYLVRFGSEGYRTIICLMDDGTLSALSGKELIADRIAVVMDNLSGRDTYVSVKQIEPEDDEGSYGVVGVTKDDEEIELDFSLNF